MRRGVRRLGAVGAALAFLGPGLITGAAGDDAGGIVTGKGFAELIREEFGVKWTAFAMLVLLVANGTVTIAEFAGIAAASELFSIPPLISVPIMAVVVWLIVVRASYTVAEKIFMLLSVGLLTYVGAAFLARPDWGEVPVSLVRPHFEADAGFIATFVAVVWARK